MATTFTVETYPEWEMPLGVADWAASKDLEYVYIMHDKDKKDDGEKVKPHYHILVRVPNDMTISAFSKNAGIDHRWIRERNNWRESALYMLHLSKKAKDNPNKFKYPIEALKGNADTIEKVKKIVARASGNQQLKSGEDDNGIIQILDYIESFDYLTTAALVRWCCANGLYSVYRRAGRIVTDLLAEHNRNCQFTLQDTLYQMKLEQMEKRLSAQEKELQKAFGDMWERQKNPFNGNVAWVEKGVSEESIRQMRKNLDEIQKGA